MIGLAILLALIIVAGVLLVDWRNRAPKPDSYDPFDPNNDFP